MRRVIQLDGIEPLALYGVNNARFAMLADHFATLRIAARGDEIAVEGEDAAELDAFEACIDRITRFYVRHGALHSHQLRFLLGTEIGEEEEQQEQLGATVLLYGAHGRQIRPLTPNQARLAAAVRGSDLLFAIGPAGTGKTYTAIALAVAALRGREVKRIVLTRPAVEAGERLGFLPGDLREKLDPYLQPLYDALNHMLPPRVLQAKMDDGTIQIAPLAYMRGRTLDNAFVILDEAQNATLMQMKMFLTRMGRNAKFLVTGDVTQIDLPDRCQSGLAATVELLRGVEGIAFVPFDAGDIVRHPLVTSIVRAFEQGVLVAAECAQPQHGINT